MDTLKSKLSPDGRKLLDIMMDFIFRGVKMGGQIIFEVVKNLSSCVKKKDVPSLLKHTMFLGLHGISTVDIYEFLSNIGLTSESPFEAGLFKGDDDEDADSLIDELNNELDDLLKN